MFSYCRRLFSVSAARSNKKLCETCIHYLDPNFINSSAAKCRLFPLFSASQPSPQPSSPSAVVVVVAAPHSSSREATNADDYVTCPIARSHVFGSRLCGPGAKYFETY
jgi:hypothetical protein